MTMKVRFFFEWLVLALVVLSIGYLIGQRVYGWLPASEIPDAAMEQSLVPDAAVLDLHPDAFMIHDRAGHISSSRAWKFVDDWFADGGKLGCRRFSTEGATLELCLDPYNTGTGCAGREHQPTDYK